MTNVLSAIVGMLVLGLLAGSAMLWWGALRKFWTGVPILPVEARQPVPWGMVDLTFIFVVTVGLLLGGQALAHYRFGLPANIPLEQMSARHLAIAIFSSSLSLLVACVLSVAFLRVRGATWSDLGFQARMVLSDVKLGAAAFVMLAPPMYFVQFLLTRIWPSEHPLQTLLMEDSHVNMVIGAALTAVIIAPLTEEILFRLIFQGWMEKFSTLAVKLRRGSYEISPAGATQSQRDLMAVFLGDGIANHFCGPGRPFEAMRLPENEANPTPAVDVTSEMIPPLVSENPYASPWTDSEYRTSMTADAAATADNPGNPLPRAWPVVVSAAIFALMHWGHGPDPVPLFFLALGLGYLYHRTHRVVPCIVVHFMVNSLSMIGLIAILLSGEQPP